MSVRLCHSRNNVHLWIPCRTERYANTGYAVMHSSQGMNYSVICYSIFLCLCSCPSKYHISLLSPPPPHPLEQNHPVSVIHCKGIGIRLNRVPWLKHNLRLYQAYPSLSASALTPKHDIQYLYNLICVLYVHNVVVTIYCIAWKGLMNLLSYFLNYAPF
jgi:hypothetical protein